MTKVTTAPEGEIAYANYTCSKLEAILKKHKIDFTCEYEYDHKFLQDVSYSWNNNRGEFDIEILSCVQANGDLNTTFEIAHNSELVAHFFDDYMQDALDFVDLVMFKGA